jgi:HAE1 family hydrophobic/amphiphilic exporter-1
MNEHGDARVNPIVRFAVERRVTMSMAVAGVLVMGWLSLERLPLEFLPSFSGSHISVQAPYPSSSPEETERLIVRPLEDSLATISGIENLTATATSSSADVSLRFVDGTDMDLAAVEVRDRIDRVRSRLPSDLERVNIRRFQSNAMPAMRFQVSAPWDQDRLYHFVDEVMVRRLQRLDGVADVSVRGLLDRQVQISLLPDRLLAHRVDVRDISSLLRRNHLSVSAGALRERSRSLLVRVDGKLRSLDEIRTLPLGRFGLKLGDVAEVALAYPERDRFEFLDGAEAMTVEVRKASTANLLEVLDGVHHELDSIRALPEAEELSVNVYRDDSRDVRHGLGELRNTGILGGGLAIFFMYLFLRRFRTTLLVAIAIPISVVMTFVFMYLTRQAGWSSMTLNILSLMGLMLAVGMLVDNSIVVIESIFRYRQEHGADARQAALRGSSEVVLPIAASTLTTMCVFLPLVLMPGGGRFKGFMEAIGLTVVVVMAASFVVAITVVPMVAARLLRRESTEAIPFFERLTSTYGRSLRFSLRHRLLFSTVILLLLAGSFYVYFNIGRSSSPPSFERQVTIAVDVPKSYSVEEKRTLYDKVYAALAAHWNELEIAHVFHSYERGSGRVRSHWHGNRFEIFLVDEEHSSRDTGAIRDQVESLLPEVPGVTFTISRSMRGHMGSGTGVELRLQGDRPEILDVLSRQVIGALANTRGLKDVDSSLESGNEEILIRPDRERLLQAGLSSQAVGMSVSSALSSRAVNYFESGDRELEIVVQHREEDRQTLDQLKKMPLLGQAAMAIDTVADFEQQRGAQAIQRENRRSTVAITADTASGVPSFAAQQIAERALEGITLPAGYEISEGEDWRMGLEEAGQAVFMLLFSLVLVYMVMASLFESFAQPLTIMFSVPFAMVGVGIVMLITRQPQSSMTDMGLIILAGIVVNNAIVLVDRINRLRRRGLTRDEAIVLGGQHRLRPILMTALTTVLGLSPMVAPFFLPQLFGAVEGRAAFWAPMGLVILGGLTTSTLLTVMVIPVIYSIVDDLTSFFGRLVREAVS